MMLKTFRWLAVAVPLAISLAAVAETERPPLEEMPHGFQIAFWMNQAALAYNDRDYRDWARATEKLHAIRPYNQDFMTHLVKAYAQIGETAKAFNMMLMMQQQGLSQDWDEIEEIAPLRQHRLYSHLRDLMIEAGKPFGNAELFATLSADIAMPEALAHDPATGRFFVGSVRDGRVLVSNDGENWSSFATPASHEGLMSVFDLAVDGQRGHLWVATGAAVQFEGYERALRGHAALLKLDLASGELLAAHTLPRDGHVRMPGNLALAPDGTIYVADAGTPLLYRLVPGDDEPRPFFTHQNFSSLRGLAVSADGQRLYVADYEVGILVIGLDETRQAWKLHVPETLNEGGIDGLYWWNNHLIVIQNGISPERVLRLELGPDGLGVVSVAPVVAALETFDVPTYGTMVDEWLYFFGASHWRQVDGRGRPLEGELSAIPLLRADVDSPELMVVGRDMMEELRRQQQNQP
jgi:sugar lactone lactonase YvrE